MSCTKKSKSKTTTHKILDSALKQIKKLNIKSNGYYCYDEEFIKINKEIYARLTIIDAHTRVIINDQLYRKEEFNKKLIKKFITESLEGLN